MTGPVRATHGSYAAEVIGSLDEFLRRCAGLRRESSLPFHADAWLRAWYETLGVADGRQPLFVAVQRVDASGARTDAMLCPLVSQRRQGVSVVEFADATVIDYVAPMLAPDWNGGQPEARAAQALWQSLRTALRGHDVLSIHKMLPQTLPEDGARAYPLALALPTEPCEMFGNHFQVEGDWTNWRQSLPKHQRKELERCWRVFQKFPEGRFERVSDAGEALRVFEALDRQQAERMHALVGERYRLDQPAYQAFYRQVVVDGLRDGSAVLTALKDGDQIITALLGAASPMRFMALRQSLTADPTWKACSPGRLIDEQTARTMHESGTPHLDFGIGDYQHKDFFRFERIALLDACVALSWRGQATALRWRARRWLKRQAWVQRLRAARAAQPAA